MTVIWKILETVGNLNIFWSGLLLLKGSWDCGDEYELKRDLERVEGPLISRNRLLNCIYSIIFNDISFTFQNKKEFFDFEQEKSRCGLTFKDLFLTPPLP